MRRIDILIDDQKLQLAIGKFAQRLTDFRRFWSDFFAPKFFSDVQENFFTEGDPVGGWRALSPAYAAWKLKHYGPRPILVRSGRMQESFRYGGRGSYFRAWKLRAEMGSNDPKVKFHQKGGGHLPLRRIVWLAGSRVYQPLLRQYMLEELQASGLKRGAA